MKKSHSHTSGFTLVEMMVVVAIVVLLGAAVIFGYRAFSDRLAVSGAAQDIAIAVRQAQSYGVSVKQSTVGTGDFSAGYGIYFDTTDPGYYTIFTDNHGDGVFDGGNNCANGGDCLVEHDALRSNVSIASFCGDTVCSPSGVTGLNIVFVRPDPDAHINFSNWSGFVSGPYQSAQITVKSANGAESTVTVESTGQISTQ